MSASLVDGNSNVLLRTNQRYIPQYPQSRYRFPFKNAQSTTRIYRDEKNDKYDLEEYGRLTGTRFDPKTHL
jgi:hypothetical protein